MYPSLCEIYTFRIATGFMNCQRPATA